MHNRIHRPNLKNTPKPIQHGKADENPVEKIPYRYPGRLWLLLQKRYGNRRIQRLLSANGGYYAKATLISRLAQGHLQREGRQPAEGSRSNRLKAIKDPNNPNRLIFNRYVSLADALDFLWGKRYTPDSFTADPDERPRAGGKHRRYLWDRNDLDAFFNLRGSVREQYKFEVIRSKYKPAPLEEQFPAWLPNNVRKEILELRQNGMLTRDNLPLLRIYPGQAPWGDIVVWAGVGEFGDIAIETYQEFPENEEFYLKIRGGDERQAGLLKRSFKTFNQDMRYFVVLKRMSPSKAREKLRQIYDEVLKLVILGAVMMLNSGMSLAGVQSTSSQMVAQSQRGRLSVRPRIIPLGGRVRPVNGRVNVGGGAESSAKGATNLNPIVKGTGGPSKGIPNHVQASFEQIDDVFEPGSVKFLFSNRLPYHTVNWARSANGAYVAMPSGGRLSLNVWTKSVDEVNTVVNAFKSAGFRNVRAVGGPGPGTMILGVR
jgi:hypothetical protein